MTIEDTYGKKLVRTEFNPGGYPSVDAIKHAMAEAIDAVIEVKGKDDMPRTRAASIAVTKLEDAAMWAVKAVTEEEDD